MTILVSGDTSMRFPRIRNIREDNDLTQQDMAEYLSCSQVAYSYYELGRRNIPLDLLIKIALFYDTSVDYLLGITDHTEPYERNKYPRIEYDDE